MAANIYRDNDKPLYKRGNRVLLAINVLVIFLFLFSKAYYVTKNKIRDRKWNAMTPKVIFFSWSHHIPPVLILKPITGASRVHCYHQRQG